MCPTTVNMNACSQQLRSSQCSGTIHFQLSPTGTAKSEGLASSSSPLCSKLYSVRGTLNLLEN